jgi:hypothetical protein
MKRVLAYVGPILCSCLITTLLPCGTSCGGSQPARPTPTLPPPEYEDGTSAPASPPPSGAPPSGVGLPPDASQARNETLP